MTDCDTHDDDTLLASMQIIEANGREFWETLVEMAKTNASRDELHQFLAAQKTRREESGGLAN